LSRKCDEVCATESEGQLSIENNKIVLATGEYDLRFYKTTGRLQIDMYTYFRRDFNLASYKLDDVAGQYISDHVKRIEHTEHPTHGAVTELFSKNLAGLHVGDFIHIELSGFTSDYYKDGKKFRVLDIDHGREVCETMKGQECTNKYNVIVIGGTEMGDDTTKNVKWGMAKDDVSVQDIFRLSKGSSADRAIVAKYCIQDCNLVHHLMSKIDVITGYVEMASICSVPISFLVLRGQGIKLTSYVAKKCREKDTLMPDLEKLSSSEGYEGAIVLPPKCSMYMDNPVACVDFASLYPSSMISQNYSHDSKVWTKIYDLHGTLIYETGEKDKKGNYIYDNLPSYQYIDIEFDTYKNVKKTPTAKAVKIKSGKKVCRWAQLPDNKKSIMPSILEELLKARKDTRKKIKTESDPFMQNILDKRQLGYKVTANSLYGQCGASVSTFYEQDVAASTTATGRMMITYVKRVVEEVYRGRLYETKCHGLVKCNAEYVYGDTDSVFFTMNLEDPETGAKIRGQRALEMTIEIGQDVGALCSQFLKAPQCLEYEKTLMPFILLSKKRYVGILYEEDPHKGAMKCMGLALKRRDYCDYLKDTYGGILNILMKENNIQKAIEFLNQSLDNLIDGTVPMEKLTITKALKSDYKNPMQIGHWVLAERIGKRDPGNRPKPGDRMKFVFIVNNNKKALMGDKIETPEYILEQNLPIDYSHYITNQLMKPLQQLFGLALESIWEHQRKTAAVKTYRKDVIRIENENPDMESYMKKKEKYCSAKIKTLLFDKFLTKIEHKRTGMQTISKFFQ
jgi:DNA polymerase elongation subunit (family B)